MQDERAAVQKEKDKLDEKLAKLDEEASVGMRNIEDLKRQRDEASRAVGAGAGAGAEPGPQPALERALLVSLEPVLAGCDPEKAGQIKEQLKKSLEEHARAAAGEAGGAAWGSRQEEGPSSRWCG